MSKPAVAKPKSGNTNAATAAVASLDEVAGAWSAYLSLPKEFLHSESSDEEVFPDLFDADVTSDITGLTEQSDAHSLPSLRTESSSMDSHVGHAGPHINADTVPTPTPVPVATRLTAVAIWLDDIMVNKPADEELAPLQELVPDNSPVMYNSSTAAAVTALVAAESTPVDLYDSGASHHMSPYRQDFLSFRETKPQTLNTANQQHFEALGVGDIIVSVPNDSAPSSQMRLTQVLYTPALGFNLVSISRIDDAGYSAMFSGGKCILADKDGRTVGTIPKSRGLYLITHPRSTGSANAAAKVEKLTVMDLHRRLGHIAPRAIWELVSRGHVTGIALLPSSELEMCEVCIRAKSTRKPVPAVREGERAEELGDEVHSDLWGPARVATLGGRKHYITFTDDATRWTMLYLLCVKSEAFEAFKAFEAWLEIHHGKRLKVLNTDRGGEYLSEEFKTHLEARGITQKLSVHDTHEEAGVSERLNRTLMEKTRALLLTSGLPAYLWGEAVLHAIWLKNRTSTKALDGRTPFEAINGRPPTLLGLPVWGCCVWVHDTSTGKVGVRALAARWVGYDGQSKGHRVYWDTTHRVTVERNVRFGELLLPVVVDDGVELEGEQVPGNDKPTSTADSTEETPINEPSTPPTSPKPEVLEPPPAPRPMRIRKPSQKVSDILAGKGADSSVPRGVQTPVEPAAELLEEVSGAAMAAQIAEVEGLDPQSLAEAKCRPEWLRWQEAMQEELRALEAHSTWRLERPPPDANIVSCRWVFSREEGCSREREPIPCAPCRPWILTGARSRFLRHLCSRGQDGVHPHPACICSAPRS